MMPQRFVEAWGVRFCGLLGVGAFELADAYVGIVGSKPSQF